MAGDNRKLWLGGVIGIVVAIVGGLAVEWVKDVREETPKLSWEIIGNFEIPNIYTDQFEVDVPETADIDHAVDLQLWADGARVFMVSNEGSGVARDVRIIFDKVPVSVETSSEFPETVSVLDSGGYQVQIDSIEPDTSLIVFATGVEGFSQTFVQFEGSRVQQRRFGVQSRLRDYERWDLSDFIFFIPVVLIIFLMLFDAFSKGQKQLSKLEDQNKKLVEGMKETALSRPSETQENDFAPKG